MRLVTVGVGAQDSPRFGPAGLLVSSRGARVMLDGGMGAEPPGRIDAWLVTDERAELIAGIRRLARDRGLDVRAADFERGGLRVLRRPVVHTNHPTFGYLILGSSPRARAVWAPEFLEFPTWATGADLMFVEASGWDRPIRFAGGVGPPGRAHRRPRGPAPPGPPPRLRPHRQAHHPGHRPGGASAVR